MTKTEQAKLAFTRLKAIREELKAGRPLDKDDELWLEMCAEGVPWAKLDKVAAAIGVTGQAVRQAAWDNVIPEPRHGWMNCLEVLKGWVKRDRDRLHSKTDTEERIKSARADKIELANQITRRNFVPVDEVRRDVTRAAAAAKNRLLVLPKRLAPSFSLEQDSIAIEQRLESEILDALEELSKPAAYYPPSKD